MRAARIVLVAIAALLVALEVGTARARGDGVNLWLVAAMGFLIASMAASHWEARGGGRSD